MFIEDMGQTLNESVHQITASVHPSIHPCPHLSSPSLTLRRPPALGHMRVCVSGPRPFRTLVSKRVKKGCLGRYISGTHLLSVGFVSFLFFFLMWPLWPQTGIIYDRQYGQG